VLLQQPAVVSVATNLHVVEGLGLLSAEVLEGYESDAVESDTACPGEWLSW
jgi:hypothetical protein